MRAVKTCIIYSRFARYYFVIIQLYAAFVGLYILDEHILIYRIVVILKLDIMRGRKMRIHCATKQLNS